MELHEEVAAYKQFRARGGRRGSTAGRGYRARIARLIVEAQDARQRALRITPADEQAAYEKEFGDIEVFG